MSKTYYSSSSEEPVSSSDELTSSEEPVSSSDEPVTSTGIKHKILWTTSSGWYTLTNIIGYPRPQGNIPMMNALVPRKQQSLLNADLSVHGDAADYANQEWMPYDSNQ